MSPLADDKREMLDESHKFVKEMWRDLKQAVVNLAVSVDLMIKSYALIVWQWINGDD